MKSQEERSVFRDFCRYSSFYFKAFKYLLTIVWQPGSTKLLDPQQVLRSKLGDDLEVLDVVTDDTLVKCGDNYGSNIVKVSAVVKRAGDNLDQLHLVAKMLPSSEFQRLLYRCDVSVAKEIFFYEQIIPAYQKLCAGELDIAPEFYGGRLRLERPAGCAVANAVAVDDSAVILLENLKVSGYVMEDRCEGLSMDHMKVAIPAIAKFHAIGLAAKYKNPEFFSMIKNYAKPIDLPEEMSNSAISVVLNTINYSPRLRRYYDRVKALNKPGPEKNSFLQTTLEPDDPWACLVHGDLWNNNVMFHILNGKVDNFKFLDFQNYCFASPMTDLLYFLLTSLQRDFENFDQVVELYRIHVYDALRELTCDASLFEKESFYEKMKEDAASELFHSILMAKTSEMCSMWDIMRPGGNENFVKRLQKIFEIYDDKQWF